MKKEWQKARSRENAPLVVPDLGLTSSPWENVYWFARMLTNSDKYGAVGTDSATMLLISIGIRSILNFEKREETAVEVSMNFIENLLLRQWSETKKAMAVKQLIEDVRKRVISTSDLEVLSLTCERILVTINESMKIIPNDEVIDVQSMASAVLRTKGEYGLEEIINGWDDFAVREYLAAERNEVVKHSSRLRSELTGALSMIEIDLILTAFCQEFERRLGQKRKGRAGRGVESVTSLILDFYGVKTTRAPEHFTAALEVDRWIKCSDGWLIGISCKRTLRERWKQAYTTDLGLLDRHKIKYIWHLITFDRDLSDEKLTEMGSHRVIFYLPDDSERYQFAAKHLGMQSYVRAMSKFVEDIRLEQS
jgi:hypothetical protein